MPVTPARVAVGQVVWRRRAAKTDYLMVIYDGLYPAESTPDVDAALRQPIRLQAVTFDPLLRMGRWRIVSRRPVPVARIHWPLFKVMVGTPDGHAVTDHTGAVLRRATSQEFESLPFHTSSGPIVLEMAARALAGLGTWSPDFDVLLPVGDERRPFGRPDPA
jgi:hypothetical protein